MVWCIFCKKTVIKVLILIFAEFGDAIFPKITLILIFRTPCWILNCNLKYVDCRYDSKSQFNYLFICIYTFPSFYSYEIRCFTLPILNCYFVTYLHNIQYSNSKKLLIILEQLHLEAYIVNYILWLIWFGLCHAISEDLTETFQIDVTYR